LIKQNGIRYIVDLFLALAIAVGFAPEALAGTVAAKKAGVAVTAEPSKQAAVLLRLKQGQELESGERKGMFWQVKVDGKEGFVSVLDVVNKPKSDGSLTKAIRKVVRDGREVDDVAEGRARSAVMGVRGLRADETAQYAANARPNMRLVYQMEDITVSRDRIEGLGDAVAKEIERRVSARPAK